MPKRILISCGELSGDEHASHLVAPLKSLIPGCEIKAMGGRNLRAAGIETIVDSETSASAMGFTELAGSITRIFAALNTMKGTLSTWRPDLLIIIDYPDFNLRLAKFAKRQGIKVLSFISPQVWAWRAGRIKFFKKYLDHIAVIFPFEKAFLEKHGYKNATFVGHPFLDQLKEKQLRQPAEIRASLGLSDSPVLAIFPGSRKSEIEKHLDIMLSGLRNFTKEYPDVQLVLNVAPSLDQSFIREKVKEFENLKIIKHDPLEVMQAADAGLLKSGTSNLQAAVIGLPFCMFYVASPLSAFIVRKFVKLKEYSIVNILRTGTVVEVLQENATALTVHNELKRILFDRQYRQDMKTTFSEIAQSLAFPGKERSTAPERVAKIAAGLVS